MPFHLPESISCQQFSSKTPRVLSLCIADFHTDGHRCVVRLTRWHFLAFSIPSSSYVLSAPSSTKFLNFKEVVCLFLPTNSAYHYVEIKSFDQNLAIRKKILFWTYNSYRAEISSSHLIWFHVFRLSDRKGHEANWPHCSRNHPRGKTVSRPWQHGPVWDFQWELRGWIPEIPCANCSETDG